MQQPVEAERMVNIASVVTGIGKEEWDRRLEEDEREDLYGVGTARLGMYCDREETERIESLTSSKHCREIRKHTSINQGKMDYKQWSEVENIWKFECYSSFKLRRVSEGTEKQANDYTTTKKVQEESKPTKRFETIEVKRRRREVYALYCYILS